MRFSCSAKPSSALPRSPSFPHKCMWQSPTSRAKSMVSKATRNDVEKNRSNVASMCTARHVDQVLSSELFADANGATAVVDHAAVTWAHLIPLWPSKSTCQPCYAERRELAVAVPTIPVQQPTRKMPLATSIADLKWPCLIDDGSSARTSFSSREVLMQVSLLCWWGRV